MRRAWVFVVGFLWLSFPGSSQTLDWRHWDESVLEEAAETDKLIFIHVGANWCHWCHVMEQETYTDADVIAYLNENFLSVEADQDQNADLGMRFRAYGWPALIVMNSEGEAIRKVAGFRNAERFLEILRAAVINPNPEQSFRRAQVREGDIIEQWTDRFYGILDTALGGYDGAKKFVDESTFNLAMLSREDERSLAWIDHSMRNAALLIDTVWGGIYQYSTHYNWNSPHYEKLLHKQARYIEMYARWGAMATDSSDKIIAENAIQDILRYVDRFLTNEDGRFYTAQDADIVQGEKAHDYFQLDNAGRLYRGIPRIDSNIYPDENGHMISSLVYAWAFTGNEALLSQAKSTFHKWLILRDSDGLFPHSPDNEQLFLNDQWSMMHAAKLLYDATGNPVYSEFITEQFEVVKATFYVDRQWRRWTGLWLGNDEFDLEWQSQLLLELQTFSPYVEAAHLEEMKNELWNSIYRAEHLSIPFSMPELVTASIFRVKSAGKAVITGSAEERLKLRRWSILNVQYPYEIIPAEESEIELDASASALYYCTDGRCEFPVFVEDIDLRTGNR